jgi:ribulose-phosphate 3-epimerase
LRNEPGFLIEASVTRDQRLKHWDEFPRPVVTPSLLACDFARMAEEFAALKEAGAVAVHLDVMDGLFVPNLSYGAPVIAPWRGRTDFPFDTHLMIADPARYLDAFVRVGCDQIIFHIEAVPKPLDLLRRIRSTGCRAALALNPPTALHTIEPFLDEVDSVLVMSVMPGFGGQAFEPVALDKVRALRNLRPHLAIAIDGGINPQTAGAAVEAGVTQLVAGSAVFRHRSGYAAALNELAQAAKRGASTRGGSPAPTAGPAAVP